MLKAVLKTDDNPASLILRFTLGIVMFPLFAIKMLISIQIVLLLMAIEFLGSIFLIAGFLMRISAFGIGGAMATGAAVAHLPNGFFINWFGQQKGEGFEFHILVVGIALTILIKGGGLFSLDRSLGKELSR